MIDRITEVKIENIIIPKDRYRKDMGDIESLAESIKTHGLLIPIIVNEDLHLIAGERRLTAHKLLGKDFISAIIKNANEIEHRIYEIIENLDRKDFTWQEAALAAEELHNMLKSLYGDGWSERKTAEKVGLSSGGVTTFLNLAEALKEAPDVFEGCENRKQALKALKKYKLDEAKAELMLRKGKTHFGDAARNIVFKGDCNVLITKLPNASVNALISDPIYGIDVFNQRFVNREAPTAVYEQKYNDDTVNFKSLMPTLIKEASRVLKPDAAVLMFCGFQHTQYLMDLWKEQGFNMDVLPGIWARNIEGGRTNRPELYFNRCYDLFVYGLRGNATLAQQGGGNVLEYSAVHTLDRDHPSEKPFPLLEELIKRLCLPGHVILDPMCGAGSTLVAAIKRACTPIGFELDPVYYEKAVANVAKAIQLKDGGQADMIGV